MVDLLVAQLDEELLHRGVLHPRRHLREEGPCLLFRAKRHLKGLAGAHEDAHLVELGRFHLEQHSSIDAGGLAAEEREPARGQLGVMLLLVRRHEAEDARRLRRVVQLHLLGEILVSLLCLLFDQDGQVERVFQRQCGEVDAHQGCHVVSFNAASPHELLP